MVREATECNLRLLLHSRNQLFVLTVVTLVAWFTLVLEAICIRQPVSLLFPPPLLIRKRGRKNKETTGPLYLCTISLGTRGSIL